MDDIAWMMVKKKEGKCDREGGSLSSLDFFFPHLLSSLPSLFLSSLSLPIFSSPARCKDDG